ncbi:MAG TPA: hypothetical protein VGQ83_36820 [Polyangia bacterium]
MIAAARRQRELTPKQREILVALMRRVAPADGPLAIDGGATDAPDFMNTFTMGGPVEVKLALRVWLWMLEHLCWLMVFTWGRFTRQRPEVQDLTIRRYQESWSYVKRGMMKVLISFCFLAYYSRPAVRQKLGYPPTQGQPRALPEGAA